MVIKKLFSFAVFCICICANTVACANALQIFADACERVSANESKSSARLRATDKAVFTAVKNLEVLSSDMQNLSEHDFNVLVYRLVDEYVEDLTVKSINGEDNKICVEIKGNILSENIELVRTEFAQTTKADKKESAQEIKEVVKQIQDEVKIKPDNPENMALVHVKKLEYFNGAKSVKYANLLKNYIDGNPYFYLTEDEQIADYIITPKVLKVKVDALDAANKRLHMALVLEIFGLEKEIVSEYQNRFVLFGAEEDEQKTAARLISKLIEQAADGVVRKIEHKQQQKLETKALGRTLS
ncbi:MAG: hypothetical protein E7016_04615 [Alphaproteobacteria bacterium]|nr:hypothetical protein [Alphaproteobacteria bacterium]